MSGTVSLKWLDLSDKPVPDNAGTPSSAKVEVDSLSTTAIYSINLSELSIGNLKDVILVLSVEANGHLPNSVDTTNFSHDNYFMLVWPKDHTLVNAEIDLSFNPATGKFTDEAKSGVAIYTWLDYPAGVVGHFEDNSLVLVPGKKREIGFAQDGSTRGDWVGGVTVKSLWDPKTN